MFCASRDFRFWLFTGISVIFSMMLPLLIPTSSARPPFTTSSTKASHVFVLTTIILFFSANSKFGIIKLFVGQTRALSGIMTMGFTPCEKAITNKMYAITPFAKMPHSKMSVFLKNEAFMKLSFSKKSSDCGFSHFNLTNPHSGIALMVI